MKCFPFSAAHLALSWKVLVPSEWIVQVEGPARDVLAVEVREIPRPPPSHVMLLHVGLAPELEESDKEEDLDLSSLGDGVPGGGGAVGLGERVPGGGHGPGPGDLVGMDDETDESKHRNATVLYLGVTEPTNGLLIRTGGGGGVELFEGF